MLPTQFLSLQPIIPIGANISQADWTNAYKRALRSTKFFIKSAFESTTRTWDHRVLFIDDSEIEDGVVIRTRVYTTDEIYGFVNDGTVPHQNGNYDSIVAFRPMAAAKTRPNVVGSSRGSRRSPIVVHGGWWNPGITPRNFDVIIARRFQHTLEDRVNFEIAKLARSRHP